MEDIIFIIVRVIFFVSLGGLALFVMLKMPRVRTLPEGENIPLKQIVSRDIKKIRDFGLATPQKAKDLLSKNKDVIGHQLEAVKHFSEQRLVYHFKSGKKLVEKAQSKIVRKGKVEENKSFEGDYWDKIQKQ